MCDAAGASEAHATDVDCSLCDGSHDNSRARALDVRDPVKFTRPNIACYETLVLPTIQYSIT